MHPMDASQIKKLPSLIHFLCFIDEDVILENLGFWSRWIGDGIIDLLRFVLFPQVIEFRLTCTNQGKNCSCETNKFAQTDRFAIAK